MPLPEGGTQATYLEVKPIMINTATENPEAAWELLKMLASAEHIQLVSELTGVNPPREDVASTPEFQENWWQQAFVAELPTGVALAPVNWGFVSNDLTDAVQRVIYQDGLYVVGGSRERPKVGLSLELVGEIGLPRPTIWTPDKHPGL